jgi:hypothetical protein
MGCGPSKQSALNTVDDSVHVMLKHDKKMQKKHGEKPHGYVPRAEHPLMHQDSSHKSAGASSNTGPTAVEPDDVVTPHNNHDQTAVAALNEAVVTPQ